MRLSVQRPNAIFTVLLTSLFLVSTPLLGQSDAEQKPASATKPESTDLLDAERIQRLQADIDADQAKLHHLEEELTQRQATFDSLNAEVSGYNEQLKSKRAELDALDAGDTEKAADLAAEIDQLDKELELVKVESDLAFQAEKNVRSQIESLQRKLEKDTNDLDILRGVKAANTPATAPAVQTEQPAVNEPPAPLPGVPGVSSGTGKAPAPPNPEPAQPATVEQIEARQEAAVKEQDARQAEQAVVNFVERKAALQEQITLEEKLRETAEQSVENRELMLDSQEQKMAELIESDADRAQLKVVQENIAQIKAELHDVEDELDQRRDNISDLNSRLRSLQEEQIAVTERAKEKRAEAESALKKSIWLESPLYPPNLLRWTLERGPRILAVIVIAAFLLYVIRHSTRLLARLLVSTGGRQREVGSNRADTVALSFGSAATVIVLVVTTVLVFEEAGVDLRTVLGGAAIIGVAFAFGAQNLMRDYFNGFVILLEDQYELNDLVKINDITGTVERVNMRTTVLRDLEGKLHFIPNGEIKSVVNRTYDWARAVFSIKVAYRENVDQVMGALMEVAGAVAADPDFSSEITGNPVMLGVDNFVEDGVVIKFMMQTTPHGQWRVRREVLRRVKNRFDELGIEIPAPQRLVLNHYAGVSNSEN